MLRIETRAVTQQEWQQRIEPFDDQSLLQRWEYGQTKATLQAWTVVRHLFFIETRLVGVAQVSLKRIPFLNRGVVWMNRGPLWRGADSDGDPAVLQEMLIALHQYWVRDRKMYFRIAPPVIDTNAWVDRIHSCGYRRVKNSQWASAQIDLRDNEERLRSALDKKWRNSMVHAEKLGLRYTISSDQSHLEELLSDYRALLKRKEFASVTPEFIQELQRTLPSDSKMLVLSARLGDERLGSILIALYGRTAEYLIGAVQPRGRELNAGQYLLWNAMLEVKRRGGVFFDVGGAHPQQTPIGIYKFKQGMGGNPYQLVGEFDAARGVVARLLRMVIPYIL